MGKSIAVCTSTGCLDYCGDTRFDIRQIRIKLELEGKLYADGTEMDAATFYDYIKENPQVVPKTTQPSIGELLNFFEDLYAEGYDKVFVNTISSKMSGTFNGVYQCSKILEDKMEILPFDTKTVCFNEGMFAIRTAELLSEGKSFAEIEKELLAMRESNVIMFAVDKLDYLVKNGRLSGAAGFIGSLLKIKPLLQVMPNGEILAVEKIRTTKKALEVVCDKINEYIEGHKKYYIHLVYTGTGLKDFFVEVLKEKCNLSNLPAFPSTPIVGCHVGGDAIGVGIFLYD